MVAEDNVNLHTTSCWSRIRTRHVLICHCEGITMVAFIGNQPWEVNLESGHSLILQSAWRHLSDKGLCVSYTMPACILLVGVQTVHSEPYAVWMVKVLEKDACVNAWNVQKSIIWLICRMQTSFPASTCSLFQSDGIEGSSSSHACHSDLKSISTPKSDVFVLSQLAYMAKFSVDQLSYVHSL